MRALLVAVLLLLPSAVYWQTVFHDYGFRDDYAHLREVREEPGKLFKLTTSNGRPVYGAVLEASLRVARIVPELSRLRLASLVLLSAVGLVLWLHLRRRGWSDTEAAAIGVAVTLLPGAQVVVGWAIAWPIALGLLMAVLGFWLVDAHLGRSGVRRTVGVAAGALLYFIAGLTYQTSALFVVAPLAALLLVRGDRSMPSDVRWVAAHLGILFASLVGGFVLMTVVFTEGVVPEAARMHLEPDPFLKLLWFVRQPLPNSLALFELRDRFDTQASFWVALMVFGGLAALGYGYGANSKVQRLRWLFCALLLPFVAHSVSLAASSQAIGYRTLLPLSGLFLVLVVFGVRSVARAAKLTPAVASVALGMLVAIAAGLANRHAFTLIAVPQAHEWQLVSSAANTLTLESDTHVFIARPMIEDRSTERVYADEFGSLSADAEWAVKEMFKAAIRQRFPDGLPAGKTYTVETGFVPPAQSGRYEVVLDMRKLQTMGDRALALRAPADATSLR
jgi:hypothetical protein